MKSSWIKIAVFSLCVTLSLCAASVAIADNECPCSGAVVIYPNFEDFESQSICSLDGLQCSDSEGCNISGTWKNDTAIDELDLTIGSAGTPTSDTGPSVDATLGSSSGQYAYLESSCPDIGYPNKEAILMSSCLNVSALSAPELSFAYHMYGEDTGQLLVEVSNDSCLSWTPVTVISGEVQSASTDEWKQQIVNLVPWAGVSNLRIRFRAISGGQEQGDIAIDDINVQEAPCCDLAVNQVISPVNGCVLGNETVTIEIENFGYETRSGFQVGYDINGGTPVIETFSGIVLPGGVASYTFSAEADLSSVGPHEINAYVVTSDSRDSNDSASKTVVNVPVVDSFPYIQDFETGEGGWLSGGDNDTWAFGSPNKNFIQGAASGQNAWVNGGLSGLYKDNEKSYVTGPCFDFSSLPYPVIDLNVWWNSEEDWDGAVLQSSVDGGNSWQTVGDFGDVVNWYNNNQLIGNPGGQVNGWSGSELSDIPSSSDGWLLAQHPLDNLGGQSSVMLRVAFGSDPIIRDDGFAFDDVVIQSGVTATKEDALNDSNSNGRADVGEIISYTVTINNDSSARITGVLFDDTPDPSTSLVAGSVTTSKGFVISDVGNVAVSLLGMNAGTSATVTFDVKVNAPVGSSLMVCNQGEFNSNQFVDLYTDDPDVGGNADETCIDAFTDSDGDGVPDELDQCPNFPDDQDADSDGTPDDCDACPNDPDKSDDVGACGCGVAETDSDNDGTEDCIDACPNDPDKDESAGECGCGVAETDSDGDGTPNCNDLCPNDEDKTSPGECGCGISDVDSDGDGTPDCLDDCFDQDSDNDGVSDCEDDCPQDPGKTEPGVCGCGVADTDSDNDGTADCNDSCPNDPDKTSPGLCGCGEVDTDSDSDGTPDCRDECIDDPNKTEPGVCGCGELDIDSDMDTVLDCNDGCPSDRFKTSPGECGCGVAETDSDGDGVPNCNDLCPSDSDKDTPGFCGCGISDADSDGDGVSDCLDLCPDDSGKDTPGICGCGVADFDSDGDGTFDCQDSCPDDSNKTVPGLCGCGVIDTDSDNDAVVDCEDICPNDSNKITPGICGCGVIDVDSDGDGVADCEDGCPGDVSKTAAGMCGCGVADVDTDGDGSLDCSEACPFDATKTDVGVCGCGNPDQDLNANGVIDCLFTNDFTKLVSDIKDSLRKLKKNSRRKRRQRKQREVKAELGNLIAKVQEVTTNSGQEITLLSSNRSLDQLVAGMVRKVRKAIRKTRVRSFGRFKKRARKSAQNLLNKVEPVQPI